MVNNHVFSVFVLVSSRHFICIIVLFSLRTEQGSDMYLAILNLKEKGLRVALARSL